MIQLYDMCRLQIEKTAESLKWTILLNGNIYIYIHTRMRKLSILRLLHYFYTGDQGK